jgi:predicted transcriptional regulator
MRGGIDLDQSPRACGCYNFRITPERRTAAVTRVAEVCNREVVVVERSASILDAARLMRDFHVGDLVVVESRDGHRVPVGILTDRDIVIEIIAKEVAMASVTVQDIMSFDLVTVRESDDLLDILPLMRQRGVRRVPVVDAQRALIGILAVDDILELLAEEMGELARLVGREQARERTRRA